MASLKGNLLYHVPHLAITNECDVHFCNVVKLCKDSVFFVFHTLCYIFFM